MSYEPLHHKYRPQTFADLVGQEAIATTLGNAIRTERIAPAYLFTGPRGTGKTSSARIMAKSLNCLASDKPTEKPCGVCDVCRGITKGSTMDVIEIDAASNTGVDNIREMIERAQFAPIQCRYKVYVIDECLTGDSLIQTSEGLIRIDDHSIKGKKVLSYNDSLEAWELKKVVRWLDRGERQTLIIKTTNKEIRCTGNHLIRTQFGWIAAKDLKAGVNILSPVNLNAEYSSTKEVVTNNPTVTLTSLSSQLTLNSIISHQWNTSLEIVESVKVNTITKVYDLEVESNHNFVANGLLVHNCHMLSTAAFNSLLKTLEEPPDRVVFVLATTDPQRVLPTIISRCQRFDYRRIPLEAMVNHLHQIAVKENINIAPEALRLVAQIAQGGLRDAESLLDQLSLLPSQITVEQIWELVGSCSEPDLLNLLQAIAQNQHEAIFDCARQIMDRGREPLTILQNLASLYRDLLIAKTSPNRSDLVALTSPTWKALCELARLWDIGKILAGQKHLKDSEVQIKQTTQPRLWLEMTLLGLLSVDSSQPPLPTNLAIQPSLPTNSAIQPSIPITNQPQLTPVAPKPIPTPVITPPDSLKTETSVQSEPVAVARTPDISAPAASTGEVWQQVLAQVEPESTKQMLRQLSHLISLEGNVARISLPQKWQERLTNVRQKIEIAFHKVLNYQVKVILQATASQDKTTPTNPPQSPSIPTTPSISSNRTPPVSNQVQMDSHDAMTAVADSPPKLPMDSRDAMTAVADSPPELPVENSEPSTVITVDEDEVTIAAQRLAKAMSGEVIGLNSDSFSNTALNLPTAISSTEWNNTDGEDETAAFDF